jgi:flagellum-specific ATP synthase
MLPHLQHIADDIQRFSPRVIRYGKITSAVGLTVEASGLKASLGETYFLHTATGRKVQAEVVGIKGENVVLMPMDRVEGLQNGMLVEPLGQPLSLFISPEMLGRVLDANLEPIDQGPPIRNGTACLLHRQAPTPLEREPVNEQIRTGIRAIDAFISMGKGQRLGIFAGSGVGKSVTMGMIARHSSADVNVIALIGERGREVQEFIEDSLGPEGLKRSVVIAVTSDRAALARLKGAYAATAVAEYFRDRGLNVMLMMDSVTRFAMAQREIGLASGEPPTSKGYTPSVFATLPQLLERAGRTRKGSITGLYTVLVDNDDMNEPIADAVRSIVDGHIVLSRTLANKNHYPAVDVLQSVSRVMPKVLTDEQRKLAQQVRELMAVHAEAADLINIGAYVKGSNPKIDEAIRRMDAIQAFLKQDMKDSDFASDIWQRLKEIMGGKL